MPAALLVFKLGVQSVRQLQQRKIEVSFEITGLPCGKSFHIEATQSSARRCRLVLAYKRPPLHLT